MGYEIVINFHKPFIKCLVPGCNKKHYARGYCGMHYRRFYQRKYCQTWDKHLNLRISQHKKKSTKNEIREKIEIPIIKNKTARKLYQRIKGTNIDIFQYKDIENLIGWKYEKVKKYTLLLVKLDKIISIGRHSGGKQSVFKISA